VALTSAELALIARHEADLAYRSGKDELMWRYYRGRQRVEQLGMAIPPSMRRFLVIANWCRTYVDTINDRQQVRSFIVPGDDTANPRLEEIAAASNFPAHLAMFNTDRMVYGRAFMSVGANMDDPSLPWIRVESPREMSAFVDVVSERITSAARIYGAADNSNDPQARYVTLMTPDSTVWAERVGGKWVESARDVHKLGQVPVVMHLNRRMSGDWNGESQLTDLIPLVDGTARSLTNLQFAQEAHGIPRMFMTGVSKGDFIDADGKPIPMFEAYFDAIHMLTKSDAKVGQLSAADLKNFETSLTIYGKQASVITGFPARYWGLTTANPPAEGAIHADEAGLVRSVEAQNEQLGVSLGWVGALALRIATGSWPSGNRVFLDWFDPATPTVSQREDALAKRKAAGVLSREGYWDELGWSESRKAKEREYMRREALEADPYAVILAAKDAAAKVAADASATPVVG